LAKLCASTPSLKNELERKYAFVPTKGAWLEHLELSDDQSEPLVIFINPKAQSGSASIMQVAEDGTVIGGHTFHSIEPSLAPR
jgi:hypothetical protein